MDITCPKCKTEYEFEDDKVTPEGVTVKCTSCGYTFKVRKKSVVEMEPLDFTPAPRGAEAKTWMIRTSAGKVLKFKELTTLQQWIVERRVNRDDQISKSGETWKRLGDIAELASFFQVVEAAIAAESNAPVASHAPPPPPTRASPPPPVEEREGPMEMGNASLSEEPAFAASEDAAFKEVGPSAAWEGGGVRLREQRLSEEYDDELPRRGAGKLIGIVVILVLILGAVTAGLLNKDKLKAMFTSDGDRSNETYQAGRKLFLLDDEDSLKQADLLFAKVKPESALVFAARAEVYTTWAQHLRERAELLERRAHNLESFSSAAPKPVGDKEKKSAAPQGQQAEAIKELRLKATGFKDEADKKMIQAEAYAKKALGLDATRGEVKRAMADYLRLLGRQDQEIMPYIMDALKRLPDDPESFYVEGAFYVAQGKLALAEKLLNKSLIKTKARFGKTLLRAGFQLAFLYLRSGRRDEAKTLAQEILEANPNHKLARDLIVSIDEEEKLVAARDQDTKDETKPGEAKDDAGVKEPDKASASKGDSPPMAALSYDALVKKGASLSERGHTMKAFKLFERALQMQPSGVEALTGIAYCHLDQEQFAMAISKFKKALNVSPSNGDALIGMAESYKVQGNLNKALDYYRAYLRAHPGGNRAVLARRNVKELERKTGTSPEPTPVPDPTPAPGPGTSTPTPDPGGSVPPPSTPTPPPPAGGSPAGLPSDVPEQAVPEVP